MSTTPEPAVTDTFHGPCLECGATVHTVGGIVQPHKCRPPVSIQAAIATAYWNGHDAAEGVEVKR
jgi:hypothetical protein